MDWALEAAATNLDRSAAGRKTHHDQVIFACPLSHSEYMQVRDRSRRGRVKIQDYYEPEPFMVTGSPYEDQLLYIMRNSPGQERALPCTEFKHCSWDVPFECSMPVGKTNVVVVKCCCWIILSKVNLLQVIAIFYSSAH